MKKLKYCSTCKKDKPIDQFNKNKTKKDGYATQCKTCRSEYSHNRYATSAEYRKQIKDNELKSDYNLTPEQYINKLNSQNGKCAICGQSKSKFNRALAVDHDHTTNLIRGLLCNKCNRGLGLFNDDISTLLNAVSYLKKHKEMP
jgi:hypothetical protein